MLLDSHVLECKFLGSVASSGPLPTELHIIYTHTIYISIIIEINQNNNSRSLSCLFVRRVLTNALYNVTELYINTLLQILDPYNNRNRNCDERIVSPTHMEDKVLVSRRAGGAHDNQVGPNGSRARVFIK